MSDELPWIPAVVELSASECSSFSGSCSTSTDGLSDGEESVAESEVDEEIIRNIIRRDGPSGSVSLGGRGLREVPQELLPISSLVSLDLSRNAIKGLPVGMGGWRWLVSLDLSRNMVRQVPDSGEILHPHSPCVALSSCAHEDGEGNEAYVLNISIDIPVAGCQLKVLYQESVHHSTAYCHKSQGYCSPENVTIW